MESVDRWTLWSISAARCLVKIAVLDYVHEHRASANNVWFVPNYIARSIVGQSAPPRNLL